MHRTGPIQTTAKEELLYYSIGTSNGQEIHCSTHLICCRFIISNSCISRHFWSPLKSVQLFPWTPDEASRGFFLVASCVNLVQWSRFSTNTVWADCWALPLFFKKLELVLWTTTRSCRSHKHPYGKLYSSQQSELTSNVYIRMILASLWYLPKLALCWWQMAPNWSVSQMGLHMQLLNHEN